MKTIISDYNNINMQAAQKIKALLEQKPDAVIAFAAGRSMKGLFAVLSDMCKSGAISFKDAHIFAVTEFIGVPEALTCRAQLEAELLGNIDVMPRNCRFPGPDCCERYDDEIAAAGGIDLAVLGIGHNGHFGYNEPATPFSSHTRIQILAPATRRQLAGVFGGEEKVPEKAVTMGIKTITDARDIIVLAFGADKAAAVFEMLYARDDSVIPAAFLQIPMNVTVYADAEASSKL